MVKFRRSRRRRRSKWWKRRLLRNMLGGRSSSSTRRSRPKGWGREYQPVIATYLDANGNIVYKYAPEGFAGGSFSNPQDFITHWNNYPYVVGGDINTPAPSGPWAKITAPLNGGYSPGTPVQPGKSRNPGQNPIPGKDPNRWGKKDELRK